MQTRRITQISVKSVIVAAFVAFSTSPVLAVSETCVNNSLVEVCAEWSDPVEPAEGTNFIVTYHGSAGADVELATADAEWRLWTTFVSGGAAADFGAITLDPTSNTGDFTVKIANGSGAGAANVGSMVLDGSANPNWEGFSSIAGPSLISGNLGGLTLVQSTDDPPEGGVLGGLIVFGNLTGALTAPIVTSIFNIIGGNATENADIEIGEIDGGEFTVHGSLLCNAGETVCADITVTGRIYDGLLWVADCVAGGSIVKIEELVEPSPATGVTEVRIDNLQGTLDLPNGIENADTLVKIARTMSGDIDLGVLGTVGPLKNSSIRELSAMECGLHLARRVVVLSWQTPEDFFNGPTVPN